MKTKDQIIAELESAMLQSEMIYLKTQDLISEAIDYVRSSGDIRAEMTEQFKEKRNEHSTD